MKALNVLRVTKQMSQPTHDIWRMQFKSNKRLCSVTFAKPHFYAPLNTTWNIIKFYGRFKFIVARNVYLNIYEKIPDCLFIYFVKFQVYRKEIKFLFNQISQKYIFLYRLYTQLNFFRYRSFSMSSEINSLLLKNTEATKKSLAKLSSFTGPMTFGH